MREKKVQEGDESVDDVILQQLNRARNNTKV